MIYKEARRINKTKISKLEEKRRPDYFTSFLLFSFSCCVTTQIFAVVLFIVIPWLLMEETNSVTATTTTNFNVFLG